MADTRVQLEVEEWVRDKILRPRFRKRFESKSVKLRSGGFFRFDAVSKGNEMVASVSTSRWATEGGKRGSGKLQKLRADALFLMLVRARRRLLVFTEPDMFRLCRTELKAGRLPQTIEAVIAPLPSALQRRLARARRVSSREQSRTVPRGRVKG